MPHCTTNFGWYLGKFIAGFTGMFFFYLFFLKEREYSCLCRARMREFLRRKEEKRPGRCECYYGAREKVYACGCKKRLELVIRNNVQLLVCTMIRKWFLENNPTMIQETVPALKKDLSKNDVSSVNCTCYAALQSGKTKLTERTTRGQRKRQGKQCLFRHCSGLVCVHKLTRRRRNRQPCVHLHISQDAISDYWKVCDKSVHNTNGINDEKLDEKCTNTKENTIKVIHQCREEIVNECNCDVKDGGKKEDISKEDGKSIEKLISLEPCTNEDSQKILTTKTLCICANKPCSDCHISQISPRLVAKKEENEKSEEIRKSNISKDIYNDNIKLSPKCINEDASNTMQKQFNLCDINTIDAQSSLKKTSNKRRSQSDTSFGEMVIADNCMDSILYNELRKKCGSSVKKKLSKDYLEIDKTVELNFTPKSRLQRIERMNSHQKLDELNKIVTDFSDEIRTFSFIQKQKYNSKHPVNNHQSTSTLQGKLPCRNIEIASSVQQKNTIPVTSYKKEVNLGKLQKFLCRNCYCNAKMDTCNDSQWSGSRKQFLPQSHSYSPSQSRYKAWSTNVQSQRSNYPCACCLKSREKTDSIIYRKMSSPCETHSAKGKLQSLQCKEKPTVVIFKNRKLSRSRNSTNSPHSSSITSTGIVEKLLPNNSVTCRCPPYKSSRYTIPANSGYKYSKNDTTIEPTSLFSSSSSLSPSKRCHSWIALSQNSAYCQEPISSSSCMKFQRWRRTYPEYEKKRSLHPPSTSCSCSLSSMEILRDVYNLEETDNELRSRKLWRKPRLYEQKKKKMTYMDERHVRWNIKNAY